MGKRTWAIIGGGNGGQTMAGHLGILGEKVRLYKRSQKGVDKINETKQRKGMNRHAICNSNHQSRGIGYFMLHALFGIVSCLKEFATAASRWVGANPKVYARKNKCALIPKSGN